MPKIIYDVPPLLVDLPDLTDQSQNFICKRKGECVQMVYEPMAKNIRVVYDVVPFDFNNNRIEGQSNLQTYRTSTVADGSTIVSEQTGEYLCDSKDEYIDGNLNPVLSDTSYMYDYQWHNRNGWQNQVVLIQAIGKSIYDSFMRTNYPPVKPPIEDNNMHYTFAGQQVPPISNSFCSMENADQSNQGRLYFSPVGINSVYYTDFWRELKSGDIVHIEQNPDKWQEYYAVGAAHIESDLITVEGSVHWNASNPPIDVNADVTVIIKSQ